MSAISWKVADRGDEQKMLVSFYTSKPDYNPASNDVPPRPAPRARVSEAHADFWMGRNSLNSGGSSSSVYRRSLK